MKRTNKYVFLDVHSEMTVTTVREESGRVILRELVPTEEAALVQFFSGMKGSIQVGFEEGTQAQWLHDLLLPVVDRVVVCDLRGERRQGNKSDSRDADWGSEQLRRGALRPVFHAATDRTTLKELARAYLNATDDCRRTMQRLKALYRSRGLRTPGMGVYQPEKRTDWLEKLSDAGQRMRAQSLCTVLDALRKEHKNLKAALLAEARRDRAWTLLQRIPYLGPVRVALLLAVLQTPWRFRTKRNLWGYAGFAVVTHSTANFTMDKYGQIARRGRPPMTRGLNRNHNSTVKNIFKGAATAAATRPGPWRDLYCAMLARGMREELARVTLARKMAAVTLRLWKKGERFDPEKLTVQAR